MTPQQFIEEVKNSAYASEDFLRTYEDFQNYQELAIQTLKAFSEVCEKNQIPYQLAWGSLLGAIRDNGQIPWDYDVDVFVPYKEKERLIEALTKDLDDKFYFYCPEVAPKCRHFFMRLAPKGYYSDVLHVDVFYLIGAPEDQEERTEFARCVVDLSNQRFWKLVNPLRASMGRAKTFVKLILSRLRMLPISLGNIEQEYNDLCKKYDFEESKYYISADSFATEVAFPAALIKRTELRQTNQGTYRIPVGYDEVLRILYKDYTRIFPIEDRLYELNNHYRVLKKFSQK